MPPKQRDIWLVPIPFSDLRSTKRRPVVVLSNDRYQQGQEDCLVMAITSQVDSQNPYGLLFNNEDLEEGSLPKPSQIRIDKIFSIHQRIMIHRFGCLSRSKYRELVESLERFVQ